MIAKQTIITPSKKTSWADVVEIWNYRELLFTLVEKEFKVRYRQTLIGGLWAIIQPLSTMVIFSFFFGKIAKMPSDGIPYPIFSYSGLLLWTYFSTSISQASYSLINSSNLISKVYFPRIIIPLASTLIGIIDYMIASIIMGGLMLYFNIWPNTYIFLLPFIIFFTWMLASGVGFWISATNVLYRDIKFVISFIVQLWIYATPVIYPASVSGSFKWIVALNPMSGLIEAHRAIILGHQEINWQMLLTSIIMTCIIFVSGFYYFKSIERKFADVI